MLAEGIERSESGALLHQEMGRFLWEDGQTQRALDHVERALAVDADLVLARRYAALIYSALGRQEKALSAYEKLAHLQPVDASIRVSLGIVHSQRGDWSAAEEAFKQALALGGDGGDAALKLGGLYVHRGRLRAAVKVFESLDQLQLHFIRRELC